MYEFPPGATGQSLQIYLRDAGTNMARLGLTPASPGASAGYARQGGPGVAYALSALTSPVAPWQEGGFAEINPVTSPGVYRLDVPDAGNATGAGFVSYSLGFEGVYDESVLVLLRLNSSSVGPGANTFAVTLTAPDSAPVAGAGVWVSTDVDGGNVIAGSLVSNAAGAVTFLLNDGNYFLWVNAYGYAPANPYAFAVAGNGSLSVTLARAAAVPSVAASTEHTPRTTAHDLYGRILDFGGADVDTRNVRAVRTAVLDGVLEYPTLASWTYLKTFGRLLLCGAYATGTVEFDLAGGSRPRTLTLTGGVWPAWSPAGYVRCAGVIAKVDVRVSDTVLTLKDPCFMADVPEGSGFTLYRDSYTLPEDFVAADNALAETCWGRLSYIRHAEYVALARYQESVGRPAWWTLAGDPDRPGRLAMKLYPAPDTDGTLDFCYQRKPRPVSVFDLTAGRATLSLDDPTLVTFSDPVLKAGMVGTVLRLADGPGDAPDGQVGQNPYEYEGNVVSVLSATQLRVEAAASRGFDAVAYRLSDPVDAEPAHLLMIGRGCEKAFAFSRIMKTRADIHRAWVDAMTLAKEGDAKVLGRQSTGGVGGGPYGLRLRDRGPIEF